MEFVLLAKKREKLVELLLTLLLELVDFLEFNLLDCQLLVGLIQLGLRLD